MKKFLLLVLLLSIFTPGIVAQTNSITKGIPSNIIKQFEKEFSDSKIFSSNVKNIKGKLYYEIECLSNKKLIKILYDKSGFKHLIEERIKAEELPGTVSSAIGKSMPGYKILSAKKITKDKTKEYLVNLYKGDTEFQITYSETGKELSRKQIYEPVDNGC